MLGRYEPALNVDKGSICDLFVESFNYYINYSFNGEEVSRMCYVKLAERGLFLLAVIYDYYATVIMQPPLLLTTYIQKADVGPEWQLAGS
jgi:hypothetical protein